MGNEETPSKNMEKRSLPSQVDRLEQIDGLRGVAIALVLLTHTWVFFGAPALSFNAAGHQIVLAAIPALGHVGVNLFLVISGFSLAWPFMRDPDTRNRYTLLQFFTRRAGRILPPYYASIVVIWLVVMGFDLLFQSGGAADDLHRPHLTTLGAPGNIWSHLLLIHNLWPEHVSTINGSYWSLALEWQLYILFPLFLEAFYRWGIGKLIVAVLVVQLSYRLSLEHLILPQVLVDYEFVLPKAALGRMLEFVLGMGTAKCVADHLAHNAGSPRTAQIFSIGAGVILVVASIAATSQRLPVSIIDILWAFGFAGLVGAACLHGRWLSSLFSGRALVRLGIASYSVYLLHQPLIERTGFLTLGRFRPGTAFFIGLALLPIIVGICLVFYGAVEKPSIRWVRRGPGKKHAGKEETRWMPEPSSSVAPTTP